MPSVNPRPMKRTFRDGLALRGFSRSASAVTRLVAVTVVAGRSRSVTEIENGRSPRAGTAR